MNEQLEQRISIGPKIMVGKPVIRGTRMPVERIFRMLAQGIPENDILDEYPCLELEDIRTALTYAASMHLRSSERRFAALRQRPEDQPDEQADTGGISRWTADSPATAGGSGSYS